VYLIRLIFSLSLSSRYHYGFVKSGNGNTFFHPKFHRDDVESYLSMERTNTPPTGLFANSLVAEEGKSEVMGSQGNEKTSRRLPSVPGMISSTEVTVLGDRISESSASATLHPNFGFGNLPKIFDAENSDASFSKFQSLDWFAIIESCALSWNPILDSTLEPRPVEEMISQPGALSFMIMKTTHVFNESRVALGWG